MSMETIASIWMTLPLELQFGSVAHELPKLAFLTLPKNQTVKRQDQFARPMTTYGSYGAARIGGCTTICCGMSKNAGHTTGLFTTLFCGLWPKTVSTTEERAQKKNSALRVSPKLQIVGRVASSDAVSGGKESKTREEEKTHSFTGAAIAVSVIITGKM